MYKPLLKVYEWPRSLCNTGTNSFSERHVHVHYLFAIARPSVCLSSVTLVRPTQAVEIFSNIFTAFGTLAIH